MVDFVNFLRYCGNFCGYGGKCRGDPCGRPFLRSPVRHETHPFTATNPRSPRNPQYCTTIRAIRNHSWHGRPQGSPLRSHFHVGWP